MTSSATPTRVSLGQCAVEIECRASELREPLDFLLRDTRREGGEVQTRFVIDRRQDDRYVVSRNGAACFTAATPGELCTNLVGEIIYHLIENNSRELLIHAACLVRGDLGILLPGVSGSGKSTLCAWLISRGFGYLTDELVSIDPDSFQVDAFTRPLNIKHGGMEAVQRRFGGDFGAGETLKGTISHLVPHRLFGAPCAASLPHVSVVVFPRYASSADFSLERLTPARTAMLLMQTFVNARNHDEHGFHHIAAFARTVTGYLLRYSDFSQLDVLERELSAADS